MIWNANTTGSTKPGAFVLLRIALGLVAGCLWAPAAMAAGDPKAGADIFSAECSECHSVKEGRHKKGPSLFAVLGRKAASLPDVNYSDALRTSGWVWNEQTLRAYLSKPAKEANPGGKMKYDGLKDERALGSVIEYLGTNR
ncbi:MAG: c-type cytochrome [Burkholderiaceae bacterium]